MTYGLKRMVLASSAFLPISEEEYLAYKKAKARLLECFYIEQKFDLVVENYIEFEKTLLDSVVHQMIEHGQDHPWFLRNRGAFDRRIMNLLTTGRAYEDSVPHHFKNIFGDETLEQNLAKEELSKSYDDRLGYRAMCALRNFVQHQGLPVHGANHGSERIMRGDGDRFLYSVSPYLQPDELKVGGKFNKKVLRALEALGEKIDLKFLIRDYVEGLSVAHAAIRKHISTKIQMSERILEEAIARYQAEYPAETSVIGLAAVRRIQDWNFADEIPIYMGGNLYRKHLEMKNATLINLTKRFVSSEIVA